MQNKISVAMATYNGERFLREQLESLYSQTMPPYEVFVSDDHSTDETHKILEEFNKTHGLKYVVNENPLGVNKNFEQAIRSCTGDYIIICDQDDLWFSDKIQKSFEKLREIENGKPALVSSQWFKINSEGKILSKRRKIRKDTYKCADTVLEGDGVTNGCTLMFNRKLADILKPFPPTEVCMYDFYIGLVAASIGIKYNISEALMYHRHHDNNVSVSTANKRKSIWKKIASTIIDYLNPSYLHPRRLSALKFVEDEYGDMFDSQVKNIYLKAELYFNSHYLYDRIVCILKMNELKLYRRIKLIIGTVLYSFKFNKKMYLNI